MRLLSEKVGRFIPKLNHLLSGGLLALGVFTVYLLTLAPGVWGFDSGELATGAYTLGIVHPPGYPLYLLVAKLFTLLLPIGEVAYRLNLLSAVFAALTVYFLYDLILQLTKKRIVAWCTAGFFAFTNYFWQMALVAEVYTLHTLFLVLCLSILQRYTRDKQDKWVYLFALVYGLSLCNHTSGILFSLAYAWILLSHGYLNRQWLRKIVLAGVCFFIGLLPYLYFPIRNQSSQIINYPQQYYGIDISTLQGIWWMVSGKAYQFFKFAYELNELPAEVFDYSSFLWRNFMGIGALLGILGLAYLGRKQWKLAVALLLLFSANVIFYINYRVLDKDIMFLPSYLIFTIFIAFGILAIVQYLSRLMQKIPKMTRANQVVVFLICLLPISALALNWRWVDMHNMEGPERFANQVFVNLPEHSIVVADWSSAVVLEYFQVVYGQRRDIEIYNRSRINVALYYHNWMRGLSHQDNLDSILRSELAKIEESIGQRSVYMTEYDQDFETLYRYIPEGSYFKLERKQP